MLTRTETSWYRIEWASQVKDDEVLPNAGAFGFPDRRWSRDPLVWWCLFEEETAIPVQVPAPSWESKRPSSSRGVLKWSGTGLVN